MPHEVPAHTLPWRTKHFLSLHRFFPGQMCSQARKDCRVGDSACIARARGPCTRVEGAARSMRAYCSCDRGASWLSTCSLCSCIGNCISALHQDMASTIHPEKERENGRERGESGICMHTRMCTHMQTQGGEGTQGREAHIQAAACLT